MRSKNQFLLHLFYTTLLVIINCEKSDILKGKQVSLVIIFFELSVPLVHLHASKRNLLLSGDVELNPGPVAKGKTSSLALVSNTTGDLLLNYRLLRHGLRPLDVGGGGDCFFKSVSHHCTCHCNVPRS